MRAVEEALEREARGEPMCNTAKSRTFADVAQSCLSRRGWGERA
jgi:hypothetical protein